MLAVLPCCLSCAARLEGEVYSNGRAEFTLKSTLMPGTGRLLAGLAANGGGTVFDADMLNRNFAAMPGVESAALRNSGRDGIEGVIVVANMARFFDRAPKSGAKQFSAVTWEQSATGGTLKIDFNMDTGQEFLLSVSPDLKDYLSALMAPVATGEVTDRDAYLELVASVYGASVADEILKTRFSLNIGFPGPVESVSGGTGKGSHAEFAIPLTDLLVLDRPLHYEVRWTPWR
jgi:hypothetical protein